jgi:hypothetical protein
MMYIADADLVIEGLLNRPQVSPDAVIFWRQVEQTSKEVSITEIGAKRITAYVESMVGAAKDVDIELILESVNSCFTILKVTPDTIHEARKMSTKDFESAVEIICARKYSADAIITDREEAFQILGEDNDQTIEYIKPIDFIDHKEALYSETTVGDMFTVLVSSTVCYASPNLFELTSFQEIKSAMNLFYNIVFEYYKNIYSWFNRINIKAIRSTVLEEHIRIAHKYGGLDWGFYAAKYNYLNANWGNFQIILRYCSEHAIYNAYYYEKIVLLWEALNRFSDLYSHREERLTWLTKIIELSTRYQKWDNYFCALTRKAWTLVTLARYEEAQLALDLAAAKKDLIEDRFLLTRYFHCCFSLGIRTNNLELAEEVLNLELSSISGLQGIDNPLYQREFINFKGDSARLLSKRVMNKVDICKIETKKGVSDEDKQDLELAVENFKTCAEMAKSINWQRGISYFLNKIADIKLVLCFISTSDQEKTQFLQEAEESLNSSMDIAKRNIHERRMAYIYESYSHLAYLQNREEDIKQYITEAAKKHQKTGEFENCEDWRKQKENELSLKY